MNTPCFDPPAFAPKNAKAAYQDRHLRAVSRKRSALSIKCFLRRMKLPPLIVVAEAVGTRLERRK